MKQTEKFKKVKRIERSVPTIEVNTTDDIDGCVNSLEYVFKHHNRPTQDSFIDFNRSRSIDGGLSHNNENLINLLSKTHYIKRLNMVIDNNVFSDTTRQAERFVERFNANETIDYYKRKGVWKNHDFLVWLRGIVDLMTMKN